MGVRRSIPLRALAILVALAAADAASPAPAQPVFVPAAWVAEAREDPHLLVLHVGATRTAYDDGHLPGARFLALSQILAQPEGLPNELPPAPGLAKAFEAVGVGDGSRVVVYGDLGGLGAARVYLSLAWLGHGDRVSILDGGLDAWKAAGGKTTTEVPKVVPGHLTVRPRNDVVVDLAFVEAHLHDRGILLVDTRPPAEFAGDIPGGGIPRPGHLPGAVNLPWQTTLTGPGGRLEDASALRHQLEALGVRPGTTLVVYCRTGMQAGFVFAVTRWLGYPARVYDGSYYEWSRRADLPVER